MTAVNVKVVLPTCEGFDVKILLLSFANRHSPKHVYTNARAVYVPPADCRRNHTPFRIAGRNSLVRYFFDVDFVRGSSEGLT